MVTQRVFFCERCAAFMPLQCDIYEDIPIVPIPLDMPTLKRNLKSSHQRLGVRFERCDLPLYRLRW